MSVVLHAKSPNGTRRDIDLDKLTSLPVGFEYFSMNPNVPQGSLPLIGGEYSRATYPDLWTWVQAQSGYCITEANWQTMSTAQNGNVPFYSSGNGSTTFRVPSLKCWIKGPNGTEIVGTYKQAGIPNLIGQIIFHGGQQDGSGQTVILDVNAPGAGVFTKNDTQFGYMGGGDRIIGSPSYANISFNAGDYNSIYGNADTVVPETIVGMWMVKAYGTIEDTGSINEQQYINDRFNAAKTYAKTYTDTEIGTGIPVGVVQAYSATSTPSGWLLCDGSAISRTTYSKLYNVIGTIYGSGDGSSTFNVPNLIDYYIEGSTEAGSIRLSGLPNIMGSIYMHGQGSGTTLASADGAFIQMGVNGSYGATTVTGGAASVNAVTFNASAYNGIYGRSDTVHPPSVRMRYIIKY